MRTSRINRPITIAALALASLGFMTGCGNADSVEADKVAKLAHDELAKETDVNFEVTCPEDIKTEAGESMDCTLTFDDGTEQIITATVESIEGSTAHFNFTTGDDGTGDDGTDTGS